METELVDCFPETLRYSFLRIAETSLLYDVTNIYMLWQTYAYSSNSYENYWYNLRLANNLFVIWVPKHSFQEVRKIRHLCKKKGYCETISDTSTCIWLYWNLKIETASCKGSNNSISNVDKLNTTIYKKIYLINAANFMQSWTTILGMQQARVKSHKLS